jgi:hypothetical protein
MLQIGQRVRDSLGTDAWKGTVVGYATYFQDGEWLSGYAIRLDNFKRDIHSASSIQVVHTTSARVIPPQG